MSEERATVKLFVLIVGRTGSGKEFWADLPIYGGYHSYESADDAREALKSNFQNVILTTTTFQRELVGLALKLGYAVRQARVSYYNRNH